jgi:hypothetical protein
VIDTDSTSPTDELEEDATRRLIGPKDPPTMSMENRKHARRKAERTVSIRVPIPAVLKDISRLGARLSVDSAATLPDVFIVELSATLRRWCRVVWRKDREVGVEYVDAPKV